MKRNAAGHMLLQDNKTVNQEINQFCITLPALFFPGLFLLVP
jgi:hypothetical protein